MTGTEIAKKALLLRTQYKYLYGAKGEMCDSAHIQSLINAYPGYFDTQAKRDLALTKSGYNCADCSGYVCICYGFSPMWTGLLHDRASEKHPLVCENGTWVSTAGPIPIGAILWKNGHVGIYVGGQYVVEARSEQYDVTLNSMEGRGFTKVLMFSSVTYAENTNDVLVSTNESFSGYIPWEGKIINTLEVTPVTSPTAGSLAAVGFGPLHNGDGILVTDEYGSFYQVKNSNGFVGYLYKMFVGNLHSTQYNNIMAEWKAILNGPTSNVNIRTEPSTSSNTHSVVPMLPNGSEVTVVGQTIGTDDGRLWYYIRFLGQYHGYVRGDLLYRKEEGVDEGTYFAWIGVANSTTGTVNIRSLPSVASDLSTLHAPLSNGDQVTVVRETLANDGYRWYAVEIDGVRVGYCRSDLIRTGSFSQYVEWDGTINAPSGGANLRSGAGTGFSAITGSPYVNGTLLRVTGEVVGTDGYVWYKVVANQTLIGYCRGDFIKTTNDYPRWSGEVDTPTPNLNVGTGAGTSYLQLSACPSIPKGERVEVHSQTLGEDLSIWYKIWIRGDYYGFVKGEFIRPITNTSYAVWIGVASSQTGTVNVREEPTTNSPTISGHSSMQNGEQFDVIGEVSGTDGYVWYRVRILGIYLGYVRSDLVSHSVPAPTTHGYAQWLGFVQGLGNAQSVNMRSDAGTSYTVVENLLNNTEVMVIGTKNGADGYVWYQVAHNSNYGYIRNDLVHPAQSNGSSPYTVTSFVANGVMERDDYLYEYPAYFGETYRALPRGEYVSITQKIYSQEYGSYYRVTAEDQSVGYARLGKVRVFPYTSDCSLLNENHDYDYPEYNSLRECKKCGAHIKYTKPQKLGNIDEENIYPDHPASDFYGQSDPDHVNRSPYIRFTDFIGIIEEIELGIYHNTPVIGDELMISNEEVVRIICGLSRVCHYDDLEWRITVNNLFHFTQYSCDDIGRISDQLKEKVKLFFTAYNSKTYSPKVIVENIAGEPIEIIDWKHLMATTEAYMFHEWIPDFWAGWGADFVTLCEDIDQSPYLDKETIAIQLMGGSSKFPYEDLLADTDAIALSKYLSEHLNDAYNVHFVSEALTYYWQNNLYKRKANLIEDIMEGPQLALSTKILADKILERCEEPLLVTVMTPSGEYYSEGNLFEVKAFLHPVLGAPSKEAGALAFAKYLLSDTGDLRR